MLGFAGSSLGLFAVVWSLMCLVSGAIVTDTMLHGSPTASVFDTEASGEGSATDV